MNDSERIEMLKLIDDVLNNRDVSKYFESPNTINKIPNNVLSTEALQIP